jgi:predicted transglutaminase-like protease
MIYAKNKESFSANNKMIYENQELEIVRELFFEQTKKLTYEVIKNDCRRI